mmetsp:Transcript_1294/g.1737  ORF Transcript_1294/g.1737 Transcript_1294/m.1737 type:complete len:598 (-) Transcript_1294:2-1795(-)
MATSTLTVSTMNLNDIHRATDVSGSSSNNRHGISGNLNSFDAMFLPPKSTESTPTSAAAVSPHFGPMGNFSLTTPSPVESTGEAELRSHVHPYLTRKPSYLSGNCRYSSQNVVSNQVQIYSAIGSLEQNSYGNKQFESKVLYKSPQQYHLSINSTSPENSLLRRQGTVSPPVTAANLNHQFANHPHYRAHFLSNTSEVPNENSTQAKMICDSSKSPCITNGSVSPNCIIRKDRNKSDTTNKIDVIVKIDRLTGNSKSVIHASASTGNLDKQLNESSHVKDDFVAEKEELEKVPKVKKKKKKKKVKVNDVPTETFRPVCDAYTPRVKKIDYKPATERASNAMFTTMGTISRPNFRDALRRVAMIIQQHVVKIERRNEDRPFSSGRGGLFDKKMVDLFSEENFVSPRFKYTMARIPMARPGMICSMKNIKPSYAIPMEDEIYDFAHRLFKSVQLSSECSIVCLIYVERLMEVARVPLMASTWRPIVMCGLLLASKVWQDLSSWNIEFASVYPQFSPEAINRLEILFLRQVKWDLYISSSLYAKYYFALRSLLEKKDFRQRYNRMVGVAGGIDMNQALEIQKRTERIKEETLSQQLSRSM